MLNAANSGSTFKQWNKGVEAARGEFVWIAESDDYAHPDLLTHLVTPLVNHPNTGIAYCQSWSVNEQDVIQNSWSDWTKSFKGHQRWEAGYTNKGSTEILDYLLYKNTIPNASAVLFRRSIYQKAGMADPDVQKCGDWYLWLKMLAHSDIAFVPAHLNYFRGHAQSVIAQTQIAHARYDLVLRKKFNRYLLDNVQQDDLQDYQEIYDLNKMLTYAALEELGLRYIRHGNALLGFIKLLPVVFYPKLNFFKIKVGLYYLKKRLMHHEVNG
jgi:hypothetical protein